MKKRIYFTSAIVILILLLFSQQLPPSQPAIPAPTSNPTPYSVTSTPQQNLQSTPTFPTLENLQISPSSLAGVTISFWHPWIGTMGDLVQTMIDKFNETNSYGISVRGKRFGGEEELWDLASESILENKIPNLIAAPTEQLVAWQATGQTFVDLNDYVFSPAYGLTPMQQSDYFSSTWNADIMNGIRFGIPATRSGQVLYYNAGWAKELGFDSAPTTTDEFKTQACAAAQANAKMGLARTYGTGGWLVDSSWSTDLSWLYAFNYENFPSASRDAFDFKTPSFEKTQSFLRDLFDNHCAWIPSSNPPQAPQTYLANRLALFYAGDFKKIPFQLGAQLDADSTDDWTIIPFNGEDGQPVFLIHGISYAIFLSSPKEQLASWLFVRWMELTENQVQMTRTEGSLPLTYSAVEALKDYTNGRPQWQSVIHYLENAKTPPNNIYWLKVRPVVEDSFMMLLSAQYLTANVSKMAEVLNATIQDVLAQEP
jgi:ABC-type glycerol-3-phosphate transport system substrate-binding protein